LINEEILDNNQISWEKIKELKSSKPERSTLDIFDMVNFYNFFKHLYREHPLSEQAKECMQEDPEVRTQGNPLNSSLQSLNDELSKEVTVKELKSSLKKLKNGNWKSIGFGQSDKRSNEGLPDELT
jgi:hypothetical protein